MESLVITGYDKQSENKPTTNKRFNPLNLKKRQNKMSLLLNYRLKLMMDEKTVPKSEAQKLFFFLLGTIPADLSYTR